MKHIHKSLLIVAAICLVAGTTESFGQLRFGNGGGNRSFGQRSSRSGSSFRTNSSVSSKNASTGRTNTSSSLGRRLGNSFQSSKLNQRSPSKSITNSHGNSIGKFVGKSGGGMKSNVVNKRPGTGNGLTGRIPGPSLRKPSSLIKTLPIKQNNVTKPHLKLPNGIASRIPGLNNNIPKNVGNGNQIRHNAGQHWKNLARNIVKTSLHRNHWCHTRPNSCLWWNVYCQPIAHCHHHDVVVCNWSRVQCGTLALPTHEVQWYLGLKGILLPGKGLGIDTVEPGSPAELVGLQPGMVLTVCNGIELVDESSMQEAIRISGGILKMTLLSADGSQVLEGTVQMARVSSVSF